eukprot:759667-Rhodomonas_salina.2
MIALESNRPGTRGQSLGAALRSETQASSYSWAGQCSSQGSRTSAAGCAKSGPAASFQATASLTF